MKRLLTRVSVTAVALLATAGAVLLLRSGARTLAARMTGGEEMTSLPSTRALRLMPKTCDLGGLVAPGDALVVGGQVVEQSEERLAMPLDLARRVLRERAVARGWKPVGGDLWLREDGRSLVGQTVSAADAATSVARTYGFPPWGAAAGAGGDAAGGFREVMLRGASRTRAMLPAALAEAVVGDILCLQKFARGEGTALHVAAVVPFGAREAHDAFVSAAKAAGWDVRGEFGYATKDNLSLFASFASFPLGGVLASYRVTDDELRAVSAGGPDAVN